MQVLGRIIGRTVRTAALRQRYALPRWSRPGQPFDATAPQCVDLRPSRP